MKHIIQFENHTIEDRTTQYHIGDFVVAYRPLRTASQFKLIDNITNPIILNNDRSVKYNIEVGKITSDIDEEYYEVSYYNSQTVYLIPLKHILFYSKSREDAEQYILTLKDIDKYNL